MIAGNIVVRIGADLSGLTDGLKKAQQILDKGSKSLKSVGSSLTKGITLPAAAAVAGLGAFAVNAGKAADELITMSNKVGISTTELQKMQYASRFVDVEVETMTDSMFKLTKTMGDANTGTKKAQEAFNKLGVTYKNDVTGELLDSKQVWANAIDALGKIGNETERDALAMEIFGRSAKELNPLIVAGGDSLKQYGDEAEKLGIIMGEDQVKALGRFDDSMQQLQASLEGAKNKIAVALLPALEKLIPVVQEKIVPALGRFAEKVAALIEKFLNLSPETQGFILKLGALFIAAGPVISVLGSVVGVLSTVAGGLATVTGAAGALSAGSATLGTALVVALGPAGTIMLAVAGLALFVVALKEAIGYSKELAKEGTLASQALEAGGKSPTYKALPNSAVNTDDLLGEKKTTRGTSAYNTQVDMAQYNAKIDFKSRQLESYAIGTNYVPSDGLAYLHKGEAVIPADKNKGYTGGIVINVTGNNIMSDRDADVLGDRLVRRLKLAGVKV